MSKPEDSFDDIPGTIHFDGEKSRQGFQFNVFCQTLLKPENRKAFLADQAGYLAKFPMSEAQRQAVLDRDWTRMLELGGNIFYISKIVMCDGISFLNVQASMSGMTLEDYEQMMLDGGRAPEGVRSKKEQHVG
jgi:protocatechuate 4,5-dioxygenase alpha chain